MCLEPCYWLLSTEEPDVYLVRWKEGLYMDRLCHWYLDDGWMWPPALLSRHINNQWQMHQSGTRQTCAALTKVPDQATTSQYLAPVISLSVPIWQWEYINMSHCHTGRLINWPRPACCPPPNISFIKSPKLYKIFPSRPRWPTFHPISASSSFSLSQHTSGLGSSCDTKYQT